MPKVSIQNLNKIFFDQLGGQNRDMVKIPPPPPPILLRRILPQIY